jgi:MFS family permease
MIVITYALSGVLMAIVGFLFAQGYLTATQQTLAWTGIFFVASAAASSAYLTVGENFPLEVRAVAISLFYAFGTAVGGVAGPAIFGALIQGGGRENILWGYLLGGGLMIGAGIVEAFLGVAAERRSLEDVAPPLSSA